MSYYPKRVTLRYLTLSPPSPPHPRFPSHPPFRLSLSRFPSAASPFRAVDVNGTSLSRCALMHPHAHHVSIPATLSLLLCFPPSFLQTAGYETSAFSSLDQIILRLSQHATQTHANAPRLFSHGGSTSSRPVAYLACPHCGLAGLQTLCLRRVSGAY
ncbi:unnamed protein product [Pleuronectes platessa]|uniref:Uncharacterized protein n=1 Tax=Pleuronectes platessa TaxID=8262 RepID=A0A9N7YAV4_PLEPL|nr:unnamed protein product [Pleuronectes platessa]